MTSRRYLLGFQLTEVVGKFLQRNKKIEPNFVSLQASLRAYPYCIIELP